MKIPSKSVQSETSRLKLQRSLAMVRTNIIAADKMTPMQKLLTARVANELAARLRKP